MHRKFVNWKKSTKPCSLSLFKGLDVGLRPNRLTPSNQNHVPAAVPIDILKV